MDGSGCGILEECAADLSLDGRIDQTGEAVLTGSSHDLSAVTVSFDETLLQCGNGSPSIDFYGNFQKAFPFAPFDG